MATAKLVLDKRYKTPGLIDNESGNDENKYPLKIRVYRGTKFIHLTFNYKFKVNEWIETENRVAKSYPNSGRINSAIHSRYSIVNTALMTYSRQIETLELIDLKKLLETEIDKQLNPSDVDVEKILEGSSKNSLITLEKFGKKLIERAEIKKAFNTSRWYKDGISAIKKFNNNKDIAIKDITVEFLEDFEAEHLAKGNSKNSISAYLRAVRSITNYAVTDIFKRKRFENYPWGNGGYSIPSKKTEKRAIKKNLINELRNLELPRNSTLWNSQRYFFWMFNNRGMNFIDIAKLKRSQIVDTKFKDGKLIEGRLRYTRSKNDKEFSIKLTKESIDILNDFNIYEKISDDFIFPIGFENTRSGLQTYLKKLTRNNKRFCELATRIGQKELNLTSYVARHSWASIAKSSGISTDIISEGLGHNDTKTTKTYLEEFKDDVLDDLNEMIVN